MVITASAPSVYATDSDDVLPMPVGNTANFVADDAEVSFGGGDDEVSEEDEITVELTPTIPLMLKKLEGTLDGDYWAPVAGRSRRHALVLF